MPWALSVAQSRALDRALVDQTALPSLVLMENAGRGSAEILLRRHAHGARKALHVGIVCGPGNNGGDGFVVARHLLAIGTTPGATFRATSGASGQGSSPGQGLDLSIEVLLATPAAAASTDAGKMFGALAGLADRGVVVRDHSSAGDANTWRAALARCDVIVDALFGTGLRAAPTGIPALAIAAMNDAGATGIPVVALDIPSGLDGDSGRATGPVVRADVTITMGTHKLGLLVDAAAPVGEVEVVSLGIPVTLGPEHGPFCHVLTEEGVRHALPERATSAYKGSSGHLVVVAGSAGKTGAALLVGRAAMRAGAGLVTIATTVAGQAALDAKVVEVMTAAYSGSGLDDADDASAAIVAALLSRPGVRALAIGPGIPTGPGMRQMLHQLAASARVPMVLDADALNLLGEEGAALLAAAPAPRVVTPHPGEMARLVGAKTSAVESDRLGVAREFSRRSGAIVVLKGARTVIATPDGTAFISPRSEPALATAGSGDVLTGIISSLIAQGVSALRAAQTGVWLHLRAGAVAAAAHGAAGALAGDLPDAVAHVRRSWTRSWTRS